MSLEVVAGLVDARDEQDSGLVGPISLGLAVADGPLGQPRRDLDRSLIQHDGSIADFIFSNRHLAEFAECTGGTNTPIRIARIDGTPVIIDGIDTEPVLKAVVPFGRSTSVSLTTVNA